MNPRLTWRAEGVPDHGTMMETVQAVKPAELLARLEELTRDGEVTEGMKHENKNFQGGIGPEARVVQ